MSRVEAAATVAIAVIATVATTVHPVPTPRSTNLPTLVTRDGRRTTACSPVSVLPPAPNEITRFTTESRSEDARSKRGQVVAHCSNEYIRNLKEVQRLGATCTLQVPREALERLDNDVDQNPEVFAQEVLARCKDEFGQLNTRVQGIKTVRQVVADGWRNRGQAGSGATTEAGTGTDM